MRNIVIILLVGLNVALGVMLMHKTGEIKNARILLDKQAESVVMLNHTIDKSYTAFIKANNQSIKSFFHAAGIYDIESPLNIEKLIVLIPPYPCDVCLDHEIENLRERIRTKGDDL